MTFEQQTPKYPRDWCFLQLWACTSSIGMVIRGVKEGYRLSDKEPTL